MQIPGFTGSDPALDAELDDLLAGIGHAETAPSESERPSSTARSIEPRHDATPPEPDVEHEPVLTDHGPGLKQHREAAPKATHERSEATAETPPTVSKQARENTVATKTPPRDVVVKSAQPPAKKKRKIPKCFRKENRADTLAVCADWACGLINKQSMLLRLDISEEKLTRWMNRPKNKRDVHIATDKLRRSGETARQAANVKMTDGVDVVAGIAADSNVSAGTRISAVQTINKIATSAGVQKKDDKEESRFTINIILGASDDSPENLSISAPVEREAIDGQFEEVM